MDKNKKIYVGSSAGTDELVEFVKVLSGKVNEELPSFAKEELDNENEKEIYK